jgi:hypothetical protein
MKKRSFADYAQKTSAPKEPREERRKVRPGAADRPTITIRLNHSRWERLKMLSIQERTTLQDIVEAAIQAEFKRRGLPW